MKQLYYLQIMRHEHFENHQRLWKANINVFGTLLMVTILLDTSWRSRGDVCSFHTNSVLEGSVSSPCSPNTCRSTLEAAAECNNTSKCLAVAPKMRGTNPCMSCTCPTLNKKGIFYFRAILPFHKGKLSVWRYEARTSTCMNVPFYFAPAI